MVDHRRWASGIATIAGLGHRVPAPGTFVGSLVAALIWSLIVLTGANHTLCWVLTAVLSVTAIVVGIWSAGIEASRLETIDPGAVVIDEVAGQWITYLVAMLIIGPMSRSHLGVLALSGFVLFRLADIVKPWPVRRLEKLHGGIGIVADDVAAGALAGVVLAFGWIWFFR